ncbi:DHA2 family efflux MFS transporter permease subunit [Desulfococcus sp.]|uniref:DHA2 family efflux MFS transporter permease subunit n=1 Tax=Desulfococcus sp. TaxID=2025834 RepID=UPI0035941C95
MTPGASDLRPKSFTPPHARERLYIIFASLLALFLSALDSLVMGAAMPTIVAELGGIHLYSWVFSSYMLSRAVALPVFGKLADLYPNRTLYVASVLIFMVGSVLAGISRSMIALIVFRAIQGVGAGGIFSLVYIVLADISKPEDRGKMMARASLVWGLASVLGPTCGGFIVAYFSWRWIFFVNIPLGVVSLWGIVMFLTETREKRADAFVDYGGICLMTTGVLSLLLVFLLAGRDYPWFSPQVIGLLVVSVASGIGFYVVEKHAPEPLLPMEFFRVKAFSWGNAAVLMSSVAVFSLSAFTPLFVQGAMGRTPVQLGIAMLFLSLGWSGGALFCGRMVRQGREKMFALAGALLLMAGCGVMVRFSSQTTLTACSAALALAGFGMGLVSIATLLIVQNSIGSAHLGVATSSHQFTRSLGGTIGVGVCGSLMTAVFSKRLAALAESVRQAGLSAAVSDQIRQNYENFFKPEVQAALSPELRELLHESLGESVIYVFWVALASAAICLAIGIMLPGTVRARSKT